MSTDCPDSSTFRCQPIQSELPLLPKLEVLIVVLLWSFFSTFVEHMRIRRMHMHNDIIDYSSTGKILGLII